MKNKAIRAQIERSSLGTRSAKAARRSVPDAVSQRIVAQAATGKFTKKSANPAGG